MLTRRLRAVHGEIGIAQQLTGVAHVRAAKAMPMLAVTWRSLPWTASGALMASRMRSRPARRGSLTRPAGEQHRELVAAETRDGVVDTHGGAQARTDLDEHLVPGGMSERVVDLLESVEVEEQHGQRRPGRIMTPQFLFDPVGEQCPVGEIGEGVVEGFVDELVLEPLLLRSRRVS